MALQQIILSTRGLYYGTEAEILAAILPRGTVAKVDGGPNDGREYTSTDSAAPGWVITRDSVLGAGAMFNMAENAFGSRGGGELQTGTTTATVNTTVAATGLTGINLKFSSVIAAPNAARMFVAFDNHFKNDVTVPGLRYVVYRDGDSMFIPFVGSPTPVTMFTAPDAGEATLGDSEIVYDTTEI